ncbi:MAG: monofunctional biosynthetic peptidoglycan transglycosylase [Myxococcota bacterium]|nr:monofunctional biosynthetic peptidoglycan transglycosylase [Myxococcota bacterium]
MSARGKKGRRRSRLWWFLKLGFVGLVLLFAVSLVVIGPLRWVPPPTTAFMLISLEADPSTGLPCDHVEQQWVDWDAISPELPLAVVLAEDQRFFFHGGFDFRAMSRALEEGIETGRVRGASTLTQQLAKNLFLWPGKNPVRKLLEVWPTVWMEWLWPKQRILEVYLNVAQFGPCVFGAEAASRRFFEVPASELSPEQAALLATVLPNPKKLRAHNPGPYAQKRRAEVLGLMATFRSLARLAPRGTFSRGGAPPTAAVSAPADP